jgi:hypothetical protein
MSVAAMGALALDAALGRALPAGPACTAQEHLEQGLRRLADSFQRELFGVVSPAWMMASSEDTRSALVTMTHHMHMLPGIV